MISFFNQQLHKIDRQIALASPQAVPELLKDIPLDVFGELLLDIPECFANIKAFFPDMPPAEVQNHWTGASDKKLLMQSLAFIRSLTAGYSRFTHQSLITARILDYGCGWGRLIRLLYPFTSYDNIFAVDSSKAAIQLCRKHRVKAHLAVSGQLPTQLPFDTSFNLIFAFSVFTHLSEKVSRTVLSTLRNHIAEDGLLLITIRPEEYWHLHQGGALAPQMIAMHREKGFAYTPHANLTPIDGDIPYGDTSISLDYIRKNFSEWTLVGLDYNLVDSYQLILFFRPAPKDRKPRLASGQPAPARAIAFYLPQYHPIPENDQWWGQGFTEWTNVAKADPLFPDHYQPHIPADLGFYDLRLPEARAAQADLAREYGIHGFCYYHYWFNGKLLLEQPLHAMLQTQVPDFPFCLCWANENWTRTWDGKDDNVLMQQNYSFEDDVAHIRYLCQFFRDPRYIRIHDRPLFLVYKASHLPDSQETCRIWREEARRAGIGELYLCRVESFRSEHSDPVLLGFDAAVEFQPDWSCLGARLSNPAYGQHGVYSYSTVVQNMLNKPPAPYTRFPCVTPSWDNSPRKPHQATVLQGASPPLYGQWLESVIRQTHQQNPNAPLVFINAWNEWGEGNHLEPDLKFGRAFLEETQRALSSKRLDVPQVSRSKTQVSIIMPVYNNVQFTRQSLTALIETTPPNIYEVIIIDNASTDQTGELLACLEGNVTILRNAENLGFARACNQGAQSAKGRFLVFLNNDTIPQQGWLTELVRFMEQHPETGVVGCKLLYPDDTIQHCGAAMRFDGRFFRHPYKFLHRNHPLVHRVRELDAVTAACFLTPRDLFFRLDGFDEKYLNGCEDMDYCTKVREAGDKIFYAPQSVLYHLESQTPRPVNKDEQNFTHYLTKWGAGQMKNEIEIYAEDGFWRQDNSRFVPAPGAVTALKELRRSFNPACAAPAETFQKIIRTIYPVAQWRKPV